MTTKELCEMCNEYSVHENCDYTNDCKLKAIILQNETLKKENAELRQKLNESKSRELWDMFPEGMGK